MSGLVSVYYFLLYLKCNISLLSYANSVDPNPTPRCATSDLDLHCLHMDGYITCDFTSLKQ